MKRRREDMEIVWQTPANPPERHDYIFRNGVRYVRPYYFEFISHAKNRWAGKTIVDLFTEEFKGRPRDYYMGICVKRPAHCYLFPRFYYLPGTNSTLHYDGRCMVSAVKSGRIQVDGDIVPVSYIVRPSQKISHFLHRHEPPVMAWDVSILEKESDVLTVCKPASIPVHPCGQYRKNTIVGILQAEHDLAPLFPIHRLDRLVSGLLILDRSASKADLFRQQIESGMVEKKYIAKVTGVFPEDEQIVNANVNYNAREGRSTVEVVDDCGNGNTLLKGKAACTKFNRISTNGTHSIVSCQPITGKTHQIRVHLQYTGHPIANDMLYLSESVADVSTDGIIADRAVFWSDHFLESDPNEDSGGAFVDNSNEVFTIDPMCTNCPNLAPNGCDGYEGGLWLRCVRYGGPGWVYECPLPDWANLG